MKSSHISDNLQSYFNIFAETLSKPQQTHFESWNLGILHGFAQGSDISRQFSHRVETSVTRFLSQSSWNHHELNLERISHATNILHQRYQKYSSFIIDDTPFEKFGKQLPGIGYHYSHAEGGTIWGQAMLTSHLVAGDMDIPLFADLYSKETGISKIDLAIEQINQFAQIPLHGSKGVLVADSWFSALKIFNACLENGFEFVTMLKSNRKVKIDGIDTWMSIRDISKSLHEESLHQVTVEGIRYRYAQMKGTIHGIGGHSCKILCIQQFSEETGEWSNYKYLLSTDSSMGAWTLIFLYRQRWKIETFYKFGKERLEMDKSRVLKEKALLRFILLIFSSYTYLALQRFNFVYFEKKDRSCYQILNQEILTTQTQLIRWVFTQGQLGRPWIEITMELCFLKKSA
ncbi:MAG: transposase [Candidatus Heimdallarchaeota archaeon]|nr:transposase [Candidatus Heimdallarchaeota archaeon]